MCRGVGMNMLEKERERDHWVTLFVNSTGSLAAFDFGSTLAMERV